MQIIRTDFSKLEYNPLAGYLSRLVLDEHGKVAPSAAGAECPTCFMLLTHSENQQYSRIDSMRIPDSYLQATSVPRCRKTV